MPTAHLRVEGDYHGDDAQHLLILFDDLLLLVGLGLEVVLSSLDKHDDVGECPQSVLCVGVGRCVCVGGGRVCACAY